MVRVLFLADTHLGFDLPVRPRIERRRRGLDFFDNFERVLQVALDGGVDLVVHGGDLLYRSRVPASLVQRAFLPLKRVADTGVPVFVVPGNHERSTIPFAMLALHPGIHIFDRPRTFCIEASGARVALAGFPFERRGVRESFPGMLAATGWREVRSDVSLLCVHQCFEGATVGPGNYTFRYADDVVRLADVPSDFAAVLAGHIHRHQVLATDLRGRTGPAPVFYPGSIERTSFAERSEAKGYLLLEFRPEPSGRLALADWEFCRLPARPMIVEELEMGGIPAGRLRSVVARVIEETPADAILRLRVHGEVAASDRSTLSAAGLRSLAPPTMNVEVRLVDEARRARSNRS